jgi:hypothetical protein
MENNYHRKSILFKMAGLALLCAVLGACSTDPQAAPAPKPAAPADELDKAIREASNYLNKQLPKGNKLVILNVQSEFPALSEYIIDELIANTVNDRIFSVVDRQQLDTIRAELNFQTSGEVSDESAQSIGQMLGAQIIISGAVSRIGALYRLRVRALSVQSAQIAGQFNRNIPDGPTVSALARSQATGYGDGGSSNTAQNTKPAGTAGGSTPSTGSTSSPTPAAGSAGSSAGSSASVTYKIGDKGPAGGWIFYDKGDDSNGWRYLEAAPRDVGPAQWGLDSTDIGETGIAVGTGKANTQRIISRLDTTGEINRAAYLCKLLNINGYNDWFLPSKGELGWIYMNLKNNGIGGLGNDYYWSSSQYNSWSNGSLGAWVQRFSDGSQDYGTRRSTCLARAVRAF